MAGKLTYSPAELAEMLDISKSTLLRWERDGSLPPPERDRADLRKQRVYTGAHLQVIRDLLRKTMQRDYVQFGEDRGYDSQGVLAVLEANSVLKFLQGGDMGQVGLNELGSYDRLQPKTIRTLLRVADRFEPGEEQHCAILGVAHDQSCKLLQLRRIGRSVAGEHLYELENAGVSAG